MFDVLLAFHVMVAVALVVIILLQRSEGGGLGMGGGGGGGLVSGRAAGNLLTRTTAILGTVFFINSLALAVIGSHQHKATSILDQAPPASSAPAVPAAPTAPVAK